MMSDENQDPVSDDDPLIVTCIPSLVATLLNRERAKGGPLSEEEVIAIRDHCPAKALTPAQVRAVEERRGYADIDPAQAWEQWQVARLAFVEGGDDDGPGADEDHDDDGLDASGIDSQGGAGTNSGGNGPGGGKLVIFIDPCLAAVLHVREREKGSPLTEEEVLEIRDNSEAVVLTEDEAAEREAARGFKDIDPERVWEEWQEVRLKLPDALQG